MVNLAKHIRIFNADPDDEFVNKRAAAISAIEALIRKKTTGLEMLKFASDIIEACHNPENANSAITELAETPIKKQSVSFVAEGQEIQMLTCALLASIQFLEKKKPHNGVVSPDEVLAMGLWSGLSFQIAHDSKEKFEALRSELLDLAKQHVEKISRQSRERKEVKRVEGLQLPEDNSISTYHSLLDAAYGKLFDSMSFNATLDREEINVLWWVFCDWSQICKTRISTLNKTQAALISSAEISLLLHRIPDEAFCHLACRLSDPEVLLDGQEVKSEILTLVGGIKELLQNNPIIANHRLIFPVLNILISEDSLDSSEVKLKRTLFEWASRIMLELSLMNLIKGSK